MARVAVTGGVVDVLSRQIMVLCRLRRNGYHSVSVISLGVYSDVMWF